MSNIFVNHGDDSDIYITQTNNPTETLLGKIRLHTPGLTALQSCGPSSAAMAIAAIHGYDFLIMKTRGGYEPQPEEVLMDFFNDPRNEGEFLKIRNNFNHKRINFNEVPQYYPYAVSKVFGIKAIFQWGAKFDEICKEIRKGHSIQIALKNPGHYITVVGCNPENQSLIYHDPWPQRFSDGNGYKKMMSFDELQNNVKPYRITYF